MIRRKFPAQYMIYLAAGKKVGAFADTVSLRQILELLKTDEETLAKMDLALGDVKIP